MRGRLVIWLPSSSFSLAANSLVAPAPVEDMCERLAQSDDLVAALTCCRESVVRRSDDLDAPAAIGAIHTANIGIPPQVVISEEVPFAYSSLGGMPRCGWVGSCSLERL